MTAVKTAINLWYRHTVSFKLNIYIYTLLKFDTVSTALFKFSRPFGKFIFVKTLVGVLTGLQSLMNGYSDIVASLSIMALLE